MQEIVDVHGQARTASVREHRVKGEGLRPCPRACSSAARVTRGNLSSEHGEPGTPEYGSPRVVPTKRVVGVPTADIREQIFREHMTRHVTACITAEAGGVLSGIRRARHLMESLALLFVSSVTDGTLIGVGQEIARVAGNPLQIAQAEEKIIGALSKSSGIATAAQQAFLKAGPRCQVVCGGWKKMPLEIKDLVRQAVQDGGIRTRIHEDNFIYLDKNYVRMMGGVREAIRAVHHLNRAVVVRVRGEFRPVEEETIEAARMGVAVVMIDTGRVDDLIQALQALGNNGLRSRVRIAFAGNVSLTDLETLAQLDLDVIDMGYAILDAPCLPMRFDVIRVE